mmetsp:Transcript_43682/g.79707  ORF Transcript_43682/g.79707 Transcript_43682/m.79707 type:complete len:249 (-) Transcript_43682:13-759(-)
MDLRGDLLLLPEEVKQRYLFEAASPYRSIEDQARRLEDLLTQADSHSRTSASQVAGNVPREHVAVAQTGTLPRLLFEWGSPAHMYERQARELEEYLNEARHMKLSAEDVDDIAGVRCKLHHEVTTRGDYRELTNFISLGWSLRPYCQQWLPSRAPQAVWGSAWQPPGSPVTTPVNLIGSGSPEYGRGAALASKAASPALRRGARPRAEDLPDSRSAASAIAAADAAYARNRLRECSLKLVALERLNLP